MNIDKQTDWIKSIGIFLLILLVFYLIARQFYPHQAPPLPLPMVKVAKPNVENLVEYVTQNGHHRCI